MGGFRVLLAVVIGLAAAGHGWTIYQNQQADVRNAITVEGVVQSTDVEYHGSTGGSGGSSSGHHEVVVRYNYTYEGQSYTSESVYPGAEKHHRFEEEARDVAARFSPGETTTVYVNQADPSRSFLVEEENDLWPFALMGLGGLFALGGMAGLVSAVLGRGSDG